jgi:hypothetical protein
VSTTATKTYVTLNPHVKGTKLPPEYQLALSVRPRVTRPGKPKLAQRVPQCGRHSAS